MAFQFTGNRPAGVGRSNPAPSSSRNPTPWNRPLGSVAPSWQAPPPQPPTPSAYDQYIAGRKPTLPTPSNTAPRTTTGGFNTSQISPGGLPTRSGSRPMLGRSNFNAADYALRPPSAPIIPDGAPIASPLRSIAPSSAPSIGRLPGLRIPPGFARLGQGLGAIGSGLGAIAEGNRLGQLIADPSSYWGEQDRLMRQQYPFLYPPRGIQSGLDAIPRAALPIVPFAGGQSPGVSYQVTATYTFSTGNPPAPITNTYSFAAIGPIGGVVMQTTATNKNWYVATGTGLVFLLSTALQDSFASAGIVDVHRTDGQPDTGGDPPPVLDPDAANRPALASPTAPFSPTAPANLPNAVPFNNPQLTPSPGVLPPPSNAPLPNPFASPAAAPEADPVPRILPSPRPGAPAPEPPPAQNPANPASRTFRSPPIGQGRLSQEGRYGQSFGEYLQESTTPVDQLHELNQDHTPGLLPALAMATTLLIGQNLTNRSTSTSTTPDTGTGTGTEPPTGFCRFHEDLYTRGIDQRTRRTETVLQVVQEVELVTIQNKLGPQIPNGGISGLLQKVGGLATRTWNFLQVDRVLNILSWIGILHNAYMLSSGLSQTLFSMISNVLDASGLDETFGLRDENDGPVDVGEMVGKWTESFAKSILGAPTVDGIKSTWKKWNRIYQAAANIINTVQGMIYSLAEILETIADNVGKIGNSLMKSGTILQNSFNWMNQNTNFLQNGFFKWMYRTQEAVEVIDQIASEVVSIQDSAEQLFNQKNELEQSWSAALQQKDQDEAASKAASIRPNIPITPADERKAE